MLVVNRNSAAPIWLLASSLRRVVTPILFWPARGVRLVGASLIREYLVFPMTVNRKLSVNCRYHGLGRFQIGDRWR
jgi:hypothetical protein